jgi:hypothetical protein
MTEIAISVIIFGAILVIALILIILIYNRLIPSAVDFLSNIVNSVYSIMKKAFCPWC